MARASGPLCGVEGVDAWGWLSLSLGYTEDALCPGTGAPAPQPGGYKLLSLCFNLPTGFV